MPRLSPEAQKRRNAKFAETMEKKRASKAVIPLHDMIPASEGNPVAHRQRKMPQQPPIVVTFGKVRITIEVGE